MIEIIKVDKKRYMYLFNIEKYTHKNYWFGSLSNDFNIDMEEVKINDFYCLTNGLNPLTECNFNDSEEKHFVSACEMIVLKPKSMSLIHHCGLVWNPQIAKKLEQIDEYALKSVLQFIENQHCSIRIRLVKKGKREYVNTSKIMIANFCHLFTANQQEPHWHWHCVIIPLTVYKNKIYALQNNLIIRSSQLYGVLYRAQMLKLLREAGVETTITNSKHAFFEIVGVSEEILRIFSTRANEIKKYKGEFKKKYAHADEYMITNFAKFKNRVKHSENDVNLLIRTNVDRIHKMGFTPEMLPKIFSKKIATLPLDVSFMVNALHDKFGDAIFKKSKEWFFLEIAKMSIQLGEGATISEITEHFIIGNHIEIVHQLVEEQKLKIAIEKTKQYDEFSIKPEISSISDIGTELNGLVRNFFK